CSEHSTVTQGCLRGQSLSIELTGGRGVVAAANSTPNARWPSRQDCLRDGAKNVTILGLPCMPDLLHLVCPHGQPRYYLLLTGIHRFLAPLFTNIPSLFETLNPLPCYHDSTQTRNPARFAK